MLNKIMLFIMMIMISIGSYASNPIGFVVASKGEVIVVSRDDTSKKLNQGDSVFVGDSIYTSKKSFTVLQLSDGSKITVRPDSIIKLEHYAYNSSEENAVELSLLGGGLRIITGVIAKTDPENYKLQTPVALMGVRGTEFSVMVCGQETCTD